MLEHKTCYKKILAKRMLFISLQRLTSSIILAIQAVSRNSGHSSGKQARAKLTHFCQCLLCCILVKPGSLVFLFGLLVVTSVVYSLAHLYLSSTPITNLPGNQSHRKYKYHQFSFIQCSNSVLFYHLIFISFSSLFIQHYLYII